MRKKKENRLRSNKIHQEAFSLLNKKASVKLLPNIRRIHSDIAKSKAKNIILAFDNERKSRIELSKLKSDFRSKNAKQIIALNFSNPKLLANYIRTKIDESFALYEPGNITIPNYQLDPSVFAKWRELLERAWDEMRHHLPGLPHDWVPIVEPVILDLPGTLEVGNFYTVIGENFGTTAGRVFAKKDYNDNTPPIDFDVLYWSPTNVQFRIPDSVGGIPFNSHGIFYLSTEDGQITCRSVELVPMAHIYAADAEYSDYKKDWPWNTYQEDIPLSSPKLPDSFIIFDSPSLQNGLTIQIHDNSYCVEEHGSTCSLVNGPTEDIDRTLKVIVRVNDDWYVDYTLTVKFYIRIPNGFEADGWV
jgi:hypothetical protein